MMDATRQQDSGDDRTHASHPPVNKVVDTTSRCVFKPMVLTVLKTWEIQQLQFMDDVIDVSVVAQRLQ